MGKSWQFPPWSFLICGTLIESNGGKIWENMMKWETDWSTSAVCNLRGLAPAVYACPLLGGKTVMLRWTKLMVWTLRLPRCDSPAFSLLWCTTDHQRRQSTAWVLSEHGAHEIPWYDKYPHSGPHWIMRIPNEQYFVCRSPYGYGPWVKTAIPQQVGLWPKMTRGGPLGL